MIANERYINILELVNQKGSITINEIIDLLNISKSTVRRDLNILDKEKKLIKVHGGAISNNSFHSIKEQSLKDKKMVNQPEKRLIAQKSSSLINSGDCVYIDSGTTTYQMATLIKEKNAIYITNSISIAKALLDKGFDTFMIGGKIKKNTEAIVGSFAKESIEKFNFSIGFFGTNGICLKNGYTTPDIEEAYIKQTALSKCRQAFILCDSSKFNLTFSTTFARLSEACIVTNKVDNDFIKGLKKETKVLEV